VSDKSSPIQVALFALLGLGRGGTILYRVLFVLAVPALTVWTVFLPRWRFSDQDERLFRAARHGDVTGIESALSAGARVNAAAPVDRKTALFRAAIFGHQAAVKVLLERGADPAARGSDDQTALQVALAARASEKDPAGARDLDLVIAMLRESER
jgi:Ankyrin repeats (3 copies)